MELDEKFRVLCEAAFDGVIVHQNGRVIEANDKCASLFGCDTAAILGRSILDFTAPEMHKTLLEQSGGGKDRRYEGIAIRANGERFPMEASEVSIAGSPLRVVAMRDLSGRRVSDRRERTREERIRSLAEVAFDGICVHKDGHVIEADDAFARMTGYTPEALVGMPFELLVPIEERARVFEHTASSDTIRFESYGLRKDGTSFPIEVCGTFLPGGERVTGVRDISKRRDSQLALLESEDRYRDLVEHCHDLIGSHDLEGTILSANPAVGRALETSSAELLGGNVKEHLNHDGSPGFAGYLELLQRDGAASGTIEVISGNGQRTRWDYRSSLRTDGVAAPVVRVLARDVTDRDESLALVRDSEEHYRSIIENSPDLIAIIGRDGKLRYQSPSIQRVLNVTAESVVGRRFIDLVHPESVQKASEFLQRQMGESGANERVDLRLQHQNGSWRSFEVTARNLVVSGIVTATVTNARDVTDRNRLEAQLVQANRLSSLGRLAATVAHEFNNVLMGMQPFTELMQRPNVAPTAVSKGAWHISNSIKRGKRIALDILRFTQPALPVAALVDIGEWWEKFEPEAETLLGNLVRIVSHIPPAGMCLVADREQLFQVMANLITNARDAMPGGGTLTVEARQPLPSAVFAFGLVAHPEQFIHISVSDTGEGMTQDVMDHIFEPLFTTKKSGGTGLGLAVAHQVLTLHGGFIFVESIVSSGTTFHLFLPKSAEPCAMADEVPDQHRKRGQCTLLMIEDENSIVEGITALLDSEVMHVVAVGTGAEAPAAIARYHPDVVLLDLGLPDMDGTQVYSSLRQKDATLPVIFATGHGDRRAILDGLADPRTRFLQKPFEADMLLQMIDELGPGATE